MIKDLNNVTFLESIYVTIFSMVMVFLVLLAISYMVDLMKVLVNKKKKSSTGTQKEVQVVEKPQQQVVQANSVEDDTELVAVITAAIVAMTGQNPNGLVVKNIKRLPDSDSSWTRTGRVELMR